MTFLSRPAATAAGCVLWGKGFEVDRAGAAALVARVPVHYWGDLDTHGFAILDRLRAWLPQTRSFLMDRDDPAGPPRAVGSAKPSPTTAALDRLNADEQALYEDLVADRFGDRVRLEQERIDWAWALERWPDGTAG